MKKHQGVYLGYIVAQTLRLLGQGIKVCVEIVVEACDPGMLPEGEDIIAVAGTVLLAKRPPRSLEKIKQLEELTK